MLINGRNSVRASNKANTTQNLGCWIPQTTEQNLMKFMLHLYHKVQSTFSLLVDKMFSLQTFFISIKVAKNKPEVSKTKTQSCQTEKLF